MSEPTAPAESPLFDTNKTATSAPSSGQLTDGFILNEVPTSSLFNYIFNTDGAWLIWLKAKLALFPGYGADTTLTIAASSITPTRGNHNIETTGAGPTSDLETIATTYLDDGRILVIAGVNPAHVVVVKHEAGGAGQIHLNNGLDYSLNSVSAFLTLKRVGADWYELGRSIQPFVEGPGFIHAYVGSNAPSGYLLCDGMAVSRSVYAALFDVIGVSFGIGDGATTFNVPSLGGRFLRGLATFPDITCSGLPSGTTGTFTGHPYKQSGQRVRLTGGSVTGLAANTDYWIVYVDANTLGFSVTRANALAGIKISLSSNSSAVISQWEDPDVADRAASTVGANSGVAIGSIQEDQLKNHAHNQGATAQSEGVLDPSNTRVSVSGVGTVTFSDTPDGGGNESRPINIGVNYVIKY